MPFRGNHAYPQTRRTPIPSHTSHWPAPPVTVHGAGGEVIRAHDGLLGEVDGWRCGGRSAGRSLLPHLRHLHCQGCQVRTVWVGRLALLFVLVVCLCLLLLLFLKLIVLGGGGGGGREGAGLAGYIPSRGLPSTSFHILGGFFYIVFVCLGFFFFLSLFYFLCGFFYFCFCFFGLCFISHGANKTQESANKTQERY